MTVFIVERKKVKYTARRQVVHVIFETAQAKYNTTCIYKTVTIQLAKSARNKGDCRTFYKPRGGMLRSFGDFRYFFLYVEVLVSQLRGNDAQRDPTL